MFAQYQQKNTSSQPQNQFFIFFYYLIFDKTNVYQLLEILNHSKYLKEFTPNNT